MKLRSSDCVSEANTQRRHNFQPAELNAEKTHTEQQLADGVI
ncbi:Unknown protein sequence [Pseudomonas savastanoi pv. glycinea]|uniref:Uncharacterized protein n=1 Tax=Pseudomonas savastanoi pv. glycinea TaxID=318 RepID=A0ABR5L2C7_PSESG|nr:Unknown protein sequence [Pseudomonas savastanoi pv. glycinea]KPC30506.1 Unknown protein sequence [Pseudomonas savastanoi pv. glycinea]KPC38131.1 Unknown protein sequence [Pseudomonas savastanoi pv. glycinea]RMR88916.1 hypothetical protein ALP76_101695 [Pseudomonas savastanoi pv. glycinea]